MIKSREKPVLNYINKIENQDLVGKNKNLIMTNKFYLIMKKHIALIDYYFIPQKWIG